MFLSYSCFYLYMFFSSSSPRRRNLPLCGHYMLNFNCDRYTTKPEAGREPETGREKREGGRVRACSPRGLQPYLSLCHDDSPRIWSTDTESTGQLWQPACCVCLCLTWVWAGTSAHLLSVSHDASGCQSSSPEAECTDVCARVGSAHVVICR